MQSPLHHNITIINLVIPPLRLSQAPYLLPSSPIIPCVCVCVCVCVRAHVCVCMCVVCVCMCMEQVQRERDDLYSRFTEAIQEVQQKSGFKNLLLEKKLVTLADSLEKKVGLFHSLCSERFLLSLSLSLSLSLPPYL